jgi:hypothetical protein
VPCKAHHNIVFSAKRCAESNPNLQGKEAAVQDRYLLPEACRVKQGYRGLQ